MASTDIAFDIIARDRASNTFDKVGRSTDSVGTKLRKMGTIAKWGALAVAAGAAVAARGLYGAAEAAIADEAAQKQLALALRNNANATDDQIKSTEDWITKTGKMLGVADDELRPALARLVTATHDVAKAQDLAALAMDVSAGTGKSLQSVTEALMKAQNGSVGALGRLGVVTKDTSGKTLEFDEIVQKMAKTFNGQAVTAAETTAGRFKRLKVQFDETKESIGQQLLPILNRLGGYVLDELIPAVRRLGGWLRENLGPAFKRVGDFITEKAVPAAKDFLKWYREEIHPFLVKSMKPILDSIRDAFKRVAGVVQDNSRELGDLKDAFADLAEGIAKISPVLTKSVPTMFDVLGLAVGAQIQVVSNLVGLLRTMKDTINAISTAIRNMPSLPDLTPWDGALPGVRMSSSGGLTGSTGFGFSSSPSADAAQPLVINLDGIRVWEGMVRLYRTSGGQFGIAPA